MTTRRVFVSYDHEGDMLEVLWALREGYFTPTDDDRILKCLDDDGEVIGFLIHDMSTLNQPEPFEFELASEAPGDDVANVTVREAALRLGVSERRVRKLALAGTMARHLAAVPRMDGFGVDHAGIIDRHGYSIEEHGKPPDFVLEVASVTTEQGDYTRKRDDYAAFGVPEYWRFDLSRAAG